MPSLYGGAYKATNGYGSLGINPNAGSGAIGFEFGDASGLGNASGSLGSATAVPEPAPVRKNIPPKRKKKGGPGRKKAVPAPTGINPFAATPLDAVTSATSTGDQSQQAIPGTSTGDTQLEEAEASGSDSDGDGSEEGEIDEEPKLQTQPQSDLATTGHTEPIPEDHVVQTLTTTMAEAPPAAQEVIEAPASALVLEVTPDVSVNAMLSNDVEMQEIVATEAVVVPQDDAQTTIAGVEEDMIATAVPGVETNPPPTTAPTDTDMTDKSLESQAALPIEDKETEVDTRPVLEQITPEPSAPSTDNEEVTETRAPLDAGPGAEEAQSQPPQLPSESSNGPAEENMPATTVSEPVLDEILPLNNPEIPMLGIHATVPSQTTTSALDISTLTTLSTEPSIPTNILPDGEGQQDPSSTLARVEGDATEGEVDLLGGLEAAVDKEASTSATNGE